MTALRELFAHYGIEFDTKPLKDGRAETGKTDDAVVKLDKTVETASKTIKTFGAAIAGVFTFGAIKDMVAGTIDATNQLVRWGDRLQMNVGEVAAWRNIAQPFGADVEDVADAFKELQLKAQDALTGGTSQAEMFQRIGISLNDLRPVVNDTTQLMDLFVGRLNAVNDAGLQNFTVDELMGDAGTRMLPVFRLGADRLNTLRNEMVDASADTIALGQRMGELNLKSARANAALDNFSATIVLRLLPYMERAADWATEFIGDLQRLTRETHLLEAAAVVLGAILVGVAVATAPAWAPMVATIAGVAIVVGALILVVDDLWTTIEGGDSVTRRFIDGMLGVGKTTQIVNNLTQAWVDLKTAMSEVARFIASTPILNTLTGGLFEGALGAPGSSERQQASLNRQQMMSLSRVDGANLTLGSALGTSYRSRRDRNRSRRPRNRTAAARTADQREATEMGQYFPEFFQLPEGPQSIQQSRSISQSSSTTINVNGGDDPRRTAEMVREVVRQENDRQLRQTREALTSGAT